MVKVMVIDSLVPINGVYRGYGFISWIDEAQAQPLERFGWVDVIESEE